MYIKRCTFSDSIPGTKQKIEISSIAFKSVYECQWM